MEIGVALIGLGGVVVGGIITFWTEERARKAAAAAAKLEAREAAEATVLDWLIGLKTVVDRDVHNLELGMGHYPYDNPYEVPDDQPQNIPDYLVLALRGSLLPQLAPETRKALSALRLRIEQWAAIVAGSDPPHQLDLTEDVRKYVDRVVGTLSAGAVERLSNDPSAHED